MEAEFESLRHKDLIIFHMTIIESKFLFFGGAK